MRWSWRSGGRGSLLSPAGSITAASLWLWGQLTRRTRRFLKSEGERERRGYDWDSLSPPHLCRAVIWESKCFGLRCQMYWNTLKQYSDSWKQIQSGSSMWGLFSLFSVHWCIQPLSISFIADTQTQLQWVGRNVLSPSLYETNSLQRFYFLLFNPLALFRPSLSWHLMTECMCDIWMCSFQRRFY